MRTLGIASMDDIHNIPTKINDLFGMIEMNYEMAMMEETPEQQLGIMEDIMNNQEFFK